ELRQTFFRSAKSLILERETGIEPATSSLGSWHSIAELLSLIGADCSISIEGRINFKGYPSFVLTAPMFAEFRSRLLVNGDKNSSICTSIAGRIRIFRIPSGWLGGLQYFLFQPAPKSVHVTNFVWIRTDTMIAPRVRCADQLNFPAAFPPPWGLTPG